MSKYGELRKEAIGLGFLGQAVGFGALGHLGTNAANLAAHKGNIADVLAYKGLQQGLTGRRMNPVARFSAKYLMGPETLVAYDQARAIGERLKDMPTQQQRALLSSGKALGHIGELRDAPIVGSLQRAVQHELAGTAPTLQAQGNWLQRGAAKLQGKFLDAMTNQTSGEFDTLGSRVVKSIKGGLVPAALTAVDAPGMAGHLAVNVGRDLISKTEYGKRFVTEQMLQKGLRGEQFSRARALGWDLLASPGVRDAHRIGLATRDAARRLYGDAGTQLATQLGYARYEDLKHLAGTTGAALRGGPMPAAPGAVVPSSVPAAAAPAAAPAAAARPSGAAPVDWKGLAGVGALAGMGYALLPKEKVGAPRRLPQRAQQGPHKQKQREPSIYQPNSAQLAGMRARAALQAYTNPLSSLVTLALLSNSKTAAVQAYRGAMEGERLLQEARA